MTRKVKAWNVNEKKIKNLKCNDIKVKACNIVNLIKMFSFSSLNRI